jgi:hypothetical protein
VVVAAVMEAAGVRMVSVGSAASVPNFSKQKTLGCQPGLEEFCGGWTIADMAVEGGGQPDEHLTQGDRFVIGSENGKLQLLPRDALKAKWGDEVDLQVIAEGKVKCLTGRVRLGHDGAEKWHRVTMTAGIAIADNEIGAETVLNVMTSDEPAEAPVAPASCWEMSLQADDGMMPAHAGFGHAED